MNIIKFNKNIVVGIIIILIPTILTLEGPFLSQQFYPSGITFVVGVDYLIRASCMLIGILYMSQKNSD